MPSCLLVLQNSAQSVVIRNRRCGEKLRDGSTVTRFVGPRRAERPEYAMPGKSGSNEFSFGSSGSRSPLVPNTRTPGRGRPALETNDHPRSDAIAYERIG